MAKKKARATRRRAVARKTRPKTSSPGRAVARKRRASARKKK